LSSLTRRVMLRGRTWPFRRFLLDTRLTMIIAPFNPSGSSGSLSLRYRLALAHVRDCAPMRGGCQREGAVDLHGHPAPCNDERVSALYYLALSESHRRTPATTWTWERLFLSGLGRRDCAPMRGGCQT
jgi:hypothetical protein